MRQRAHVLSATTLVLLAACAGPGAPTDPAPQLAPAAADTPHVAIGDPAPPLQVASWLRGQPSAGFERGQVYLVDVWAVWCMPCVAGLPHLAELQDRYGPKGLRVIALTGPDTAGNTPEAVGRFLERRCAAAKFDVAFDSEAAGEPPYLGVFRGRTTAALLKAAEVDGIPQAFVIDRESRIAWIGTSTAAEPVVAAVLAGTWDLVAAAKSRQAGLDAQRQLVELQRLVQDGPPDEARRLAQSLVNGPCANDPTVLWAVAMRLAQMSNPSPADLDLALRAARHADDLTAHADLQVLVTLAKVHALRHDWPDAIATQEHAVAIAESPLKERLAKTLADYRAASAPKSP